MFRIFPLLAIAGCLPAPAAIAPLYPAALSLRCEGQLTRDDLAAPGVPSARTAWQQERAWRALVLLAWRTAPTPTLARRDDVAPPPLDSVEPVQVTDPAGSGVDWLPFNLPAAVQP